MSTLAMEVYSFTALSVTAHLGRNLVSQVISEHITEDKPQGRRRWIRRRGHHHHNHLKIIEHDDH